MDEKQSTKKKGRTTRNVILLVALGSVFLLVLAIVFPAVANRFQTLNRATRVPKIDVRLTDEDGNSHRVQTIFAVQYDRSDRDTSRRISDTDLHRVIEGLVRELDIASIDNTDSVEYVNGQITRMFNERLGLEDDGSVRVFVTDLVVDDRTILESPEPDRNTMMRWLFPNLN